MCYSKRNLRSPVEPYDLDATARSILQKTKHILISTLGRSLNEASDEEVYRAVTQVLREEVMINWLASIHTFQSKNVKRMYYFSLEWLIGRSLVNNMVNISHFEVIRRVIKLMNRDFRSVVAKEPDAGLGNGGLGRLAACFMDSLATLNFPARGYGLRYQYGIFKQELYSGHQLEKPDDWLLHEYPLEMRRDLHEKTVAYGGRLVCSKNRSDEDIVNVVDYQDVRTIPFDIAIVGYGESSDFMALTLRIWSTAVATQNFAIQRFNEGDIADALSNMAITHLLYPNDQNLLGFYMRIKQEFLLVSASLQDIIKEHLSIGNTIGNLPEKVVIQLNDTHPVFAIPELMRILTEENHVAWKDAWEMTSTIFNYTNHTILRESLEEWDRKHIRELLPRQMHIIERINYDFCSNIRKRYPEDEGKVRRMSIIENERIRMAHLAIVGSKHVNGVALIHSNLVKTKLFPEFNEFYPDKFLNITNGVTFRRWLLKCNPELSNMVTSLIGSKWITDFERIQDLHMFVDKSEIKERFLEIKKNNKKNLIESICRWKRDRYQDQVQLDKELFLEKNAIFDVQVKRIHEYKRQLMNLLRIIVVYNEIKKNPNQNLVSKMIILGGKAAPGYVLAKDFIRLAYMLSRKINHDPAMQGHLKLQFIEDYKVSSAEVIIPAAELSEQISTAGYEASGTGNMKFAINGALTIGTDDGANVEMRKAVGDANWPFLFGHSAEEIAKMEMEKSYRPKAVLDEHPEIKLAVDSLLDGTWAENAAEEKVLKEIHNHLFQGEKPDRFFTLKDLPSYLNAHKKVDLLYQDQDKWAEMSLNNMASMGYFSSDRAIKEYAEKIWGILPCPINQHELTSVRKEFHEHDRCFFEAS